MEGSSPLLRHPGLSWSRAIHYDPIHVIGGVLVDSFVKTLTGKRWKKGIPLAEKELRRFSAAPGMLTEAGRQLFEDALVSIADQLPSRTGCGRLPQILRASKKSRTHTAFLLASPIGLYALSCVRDQFADPMTYNTLQRLLQACYILWSKDLHVDSLPYLYHLIVEAVCMVELYLPVSERDIKLHELVELFHLARDYGPVYSVSLFRAESLWGQLLNMMHNKAYPESTMLEAYAIKEIVSLYSPDSFATEPEDTWGLHKQVQKQGKSCTVGKVIRFGDQTPKDFLCSLVHMHYCDTVPRYAELWDWFLRPTVVSLPSGLRTQFGIQGAQGEPLGNRTINAKELTCLRFYWSVDMSWVPTGVHLSDQDKSMMQPWGFDDLIFHDSVILDGDFKVHVGKWAMSSRAEFDESMHHSTLSCPKTLWFGRVQEIFSHTWLGETRTFLHCKWFKSLPQHGFAFDPCLQTPVLSTRVCQNHARLVKATDIVPLHVAVVPHSEDSNKQVAVTRTWAPLTSIGLSCPWPELIHYPT